jgi:hypothetical protein
MAKRYYTAGTGSNGDKGGVVREDYSARSNLPRGVKMGDYPKIDYTMNQGMDDTIRGVDRQMNADARGGRRRNPKDPGKW